MRRFTTFELGWMQRIELCLPMLSAHTHHMNRSYHGILGATKPCLHERDSLWSIKEWLNKVEKLTSPEPYTGSQESPTVTDTSECGTNNKGSCHNALNRLSTSAVAGVSGDELPETVVVHLWNIFDKLFDSASGSSHSYLYIPHSNLRLQLDPLDLEARQYEFFSLLAEVNEIDLGKVEELSDRLKGAIEGESKHKSPNSVERDNKGSRTNSMDNSRKYKQVCGSKFIKTLDALKDAVTPMYCRWLSQSASLRRIQQASLGSEAFSSWGGSCTSLSSTYSLAPVSQYGRGAPGIIKIMHMRGELLAAKGRILKRVKNGTLGDILIHDGSQGVTRCTAAKCNEYVEAINTLNDTALRLLKQWMRKGEGIVLRELRWDGADTNPEMLERIIAGEIVHPFESPPMTSIKNRLQPCAQEPRYLYCFFHEQAPLVPLIAVQVALTRGIADSVDCILGRLVVPRKEKESTPQASSTQIIKPYDSAMFYSINSVQGGLEGGDLGNALIKAVVEHLQQHGHKQVQHYLIKEVSQERQALAKKRPNNITTKSELTSIPYQPPLLHYCTLSPIPNYCKWMVQEVQKILDMLMSDKDSVINKSTPEKDINGLPSTDCVIAGAIISSGSRLFGPIIADKANNSNNNNISKGCDVGITNSVQNIDPHFISESTSPPPISYDTLICYAQSLIAFVDTYCAIGLSQGVASEYEKQFVKCTPSSQRTISSATTEAVQVLETFKDIMLFGALKGSSMKWFSSTEEKANNNNNPHNDTVHNNIPSYGYLQGLIYRPILRSIGCYLCLEKRRGKILDPVGNFHCSNGAQIYRLNWLANRTLKGSMESCCVMVNYYYLNNDDENRSCNEESDMKCENTNNRRSDQVTTEPSSSNMISRNAYMYQTRSIITLGKPLLDMLKHP